MSELEHWKVNMRVRVQFSIILGRLRKAGSDFKVKFEMEGLEILGVDLEKADVRKLIGIRCPWRQKKLDASLLFILSIGDGGRVEVTMVSETF